MIYTKDNIITKVNVEEQADEMSLNEFNYFLSFIQLPGDSKTVRVSATGSGLGIVEVR